MKQFESRLKAVEKEVDKCIKRWERNNIENRPFNPNVIDIEALKVGYFALIVIISYIIIIIMFGTCIVLKIK